MSILNKLGQFFLPVYIYVLYIRSVLEQSSVVWNSSITKGEQLDIEWVQKCALRIILKDDCTSYLESLEMTGLQTLKARQNQLSLTFTMKCTKNEKTRDIFPISENVANTRHMKNIYWQSLEQTG